MKLFLLAYRPQLDVITELLVSYTVTAINTPSYLLPLPPAAPFTHCGTGSAWQPYCALHCMACHHDRERERERGGGG